MNLAEIVDLQAEFYGEISSKSNLDDEPPDKFTMGSSLCLCGVRSSRSGRNDFDLKEKRKKNRVSVEPNKFYRIRLRKILGVFLHEKILRKINLKQKISKRKNDRDEKRSIRSSEKRENDEDCLRETCFSGYCALLSDDFI